MIIARKEEQAILRNAYESEYSELIAIYGRRRVGKTFLVRETFDYTFTFQHAGVYMKNKKGRLKAQMFAFCASLKEAGMKVTEMPGDWFEAFELLKDLIRQSKDKRKVIFIDELSWMDARGGELIPAFENFWNNWASNRKDILLIVCASAANWMIKKIIHNKGGLYNRLSAEIDLRQFNLKECEEFSKAMHLPFGREQILECYMIMGGVPYYWKQLDRSKSLSQNINRLFFAENAKLKEEFDYLFDSLYDAPEEYVRVITALGTKRMGLTRNEIIEAIGKNNGGGLSAILKDLENAHFIREYTAYGKKSKDSLYQLMDSFILFWFRFKMDKSVSETLWTENINTPARNTWNGYAFERTCLLHIPQIKFKLGISGVRTNVYSWHCAADEEKGIVGAQIDLVIERADNIINLCEEKYSGVEYAIDAAYEKTLLQKIDSFIKDTGTKKPVQLTLVTANGLKHNSHSDIVHAEVVADDLFT